MHLSDSQAARLYRILDELTVYANLKCQLMPARELFDPATRGVTDYARSEVLPVVWDVPGIIDEFVEKNPAGLSRADLDEALRWKDNVSGYDLLLDYDAAGRALFAVGDDVVAVTGITRDISRVIARKAPALVHLTMIAFEDVVTYDTIIRLQDVKMGPGIQRMMEEERSSFGARRVVERANDFIGVARRERERRREDDLRRLEEHLEHDRIEAGGTEALPEGVRRGALAGLSEDERARAVDAALSELFSGGSAPSARGARSLARERAKELKRCADFHAPVTRLEDTLDADVKSVLEREAMRLGIARSSKMRKAELAHAVAAAMLEGDEAVRELVSFLRGCLDSEYETFRRLLSLPQGAVAFSEKDAASYADMACYPPYSRLLYHAGAFTAVIPDEFRDAAASIDFEAIDAYRTRAARIAHAGEVLVDLRGVVPVRDVGECARELYGIELSEDELVDELHDAADREMPHPPFEFWRPQHAPGDRRAGDSSGAQASPWYLVHWSIGDHVVSEQVATELSREIEGLLDEGLPPEELTDRMSRSLDRDEAYGRVQRALEQRDAYVEDLLRRHQEKRELGPCPVDRSLAERDVIEWERALPQAVSLRNWLDAHVPEGENDYLFADDVIDQLIEAHDPSDDPRAMARAAADLGLLTLSDDHQGVVGRLMALSNALPCWANNGWPPLAVYEREVGHRVFYNPDGTEMRVGRNDPCPCGSGKKYKKCCGR